MKHPKSISIPEIEISAPRFWDELEESYRPNILEEGGFHFTDLYFYLVHTIHRSAIVHSIAKHLYDNKQVYSRSHDYSYLLLKAAFLESLFGIRESITGLVNQVYRLSVDTTKMGATHRIHKKIMNSGIEVAEQLDEIIPKGSRFSNYIEKYRHPLVHEEDLSRVEASDMLSAIFGHVQPRIESFILDAKDIADWFLQLEEKIAIKCRRKLKI